MIRKPIYEYTYLESGLKATGVKHPVFNDNDLIYLFEIEVNDSGEEWIRITTGDRVEKIKMYQGNSIAIVYDANGGYIFDGSYFYTMGITGETIPGRKSISTGTGMETITDYTVDTNDLLLSDFSSDLLPVS